MSRPSNVTAEVSDAIHTVVNVRWTTTVDSVGYVEFGPTPATYDRPFRAGKGFLYEGGLRIPLIVRWTGKVQSGAIVDSSDELRSPLET